MATSRTTPDHRDAIMLLARAGYGARGIVYLLVGGLAALAVLGQGGQTTGSRGVLQRVMLAPWGDVLIGIMVVGLLGFALWRGIQAIKDTDHHGTTAKGLLVRSGLFASSISHIMLAVFAASLIFTLGGSSGGSGSGAAGIATWLMSQSYGRWLVAAVGVALAGAGFAHEIKAWKTQFDRHFNMPTRVKYWAYPICRFGLVIRGLVFVIVGVFFIMAAYQLDPDEAGGIAEVFTMLSTQAFGQSLLVLVASGLFAFGIYSWLEAVYRRIEP
ncbi:DUF1206 domain-containing protein [Marinobacter vulgaris]|uniref:DUF1206 domain-containing protein n=1 Tax=Marinobacter vulgaris TaxID=1928331 RepID=A0A2V3ZNN5_9GAMM|nr:DUF1206 domain-containing protein [Marinobacter vulgaris]PXX91623.1 DUF1206 domain-containing protein [Marinobacter vulgaris]TSJ70874.1 DUF1206 domain-containing protein [Marinobacter vulgaris]